MARITASREQLKPDPVHGSLLAAKFINCLMLDGKKSTAQRVFYDALDNIKERLPDEEPIEVFTQAIENVSELPFVRWVGLARPEQKVHPILARQLAEEKEAVAQYGSSDSGASLGDILGEALKAKKD